MIWRCAMGTRAKSEEIIAILCDVRLSFREVENIAQAGSAIGVTEQACYRWRKEYGGLRVG